MKLFIVILLSAHCHASFFQEFNDAMFSVQNSFENLVDDVKATIECTVYAVKRVLSLGGITEESSNENGCDNDRRPIYDSQVNIEFQTRGKEYFSKQIDISITNVNKTLFNLVQKHNSGDNTDSMKNELRSETDRLSEISALLMHELENITKNVKRKYNNLDLNVDKPSLENVWSDIKVLQEIEKTDNNKTETKGIHKVFDKILDILKINDTDSTLSDNDKTEKIIRSLETRTNTNITDADITFSEWKKNGIIRNEKLQNQINEDIPTSFKQISHQIFVKSKKNSEESEAINADDNLQKVQDRISEDLPESIKNISRDILKKSDAKLQNQNNEDIATSFRQISHQIFFKSKKNSEESEAIDADDNLRQVQDRISGVLPESLKNIGQDILKKSDPNTIIDSDENTATSYFDLKKHKNDKWEGQEKSDDNYPKSFKDLSKMIFKKQVKYPQKGESSNRVSRYDENNDSPKYFSSFSDLMPQDEVSQADAVQQAQNIIEGNKYSEMIMSQFFDNPTAVTENVFDNPDLFSFK